jgi:Flp pilus assembly CpaE family ATPase
MNKDALTILLIEDDPEFADLVRLWTAGSPAPPVLSLNWTDTLEAGLDRLAKGGIDVIVLDLGLPDSSGFETFASIKAADPGIPVVILSAGDSQGLALQAIQDGAEDYLVKSTCSPELLQRTVLHAVVRHAARGATGSAGPALDQNRTIGILGAKGGTGSTTIACILAAELCRQTGQRVLLTGLDFRADLVGFLMGLPIRHSMRDAVGAMDRLDQTLWDGLVSRGPDGLDVISSTDPSEEDELPSDEVPRLLNRIKPFYRWIVLDLGRRTSRSMSLMDSVDDVFVVTTNALSALYEAKRLVCALREAPVEESRLGLIINEIVQTRPLPEREIPKIFGVRMYKRLSSDHAELEEACLQKRLPRENSNIRKQIAALTRKVANLPDPLSLQRASWLPSIARKIGWNRAGLARKEAA